MTRAIGYTRVSTNEQAQSGLSLGAQRRKVEAQAIVSDLELVNVLEDPGASAASLQRTGMCELLAQINSGQVDMVIVSKLDRLTRNIGDLAGLLDSLSKARRADGGKGVDLIACEESLDTSTATGRLVINIMASVSQWEREVIAERTSAALQELRAQGRSTGAPPYGYNAVDGKLVRNEEEQAVMARIEELRTDGQSLQMVADTLTREGVRTRGGREFSRQGIAHIAKKHGLEGAPQ